MDLHSLFLESSDMIRANLLYLLSLWSCDCMLISESMYVRPVTFVSQALLEVITLASSPVNFEKYLSRSLIATMEA